MAQNQSLQHKRSSIAGRQPTTAQVAVGELAINLADKTIYTKTPSSVIIALERDVTKSLLAPTSPSAGDLWYDLTNEVLNLWNGTDWVNVAFAGLEVLPVNTTAVPTFTSGSGTSASPYVFSVTTGAGTSALTNRVTITGLAPNQYVPIVDLNAASNGGRFSVTNQIADNNGTLEFNIIFTDLPASGVGVNYVANLQIGTSTVYMNITGAIASSFPQTLNFPTSTSSSLTLWTSTSNDLTSTGDMLISLDGVTYSQGPLAITNGDILRTKWAGNAGSGTGVDGANGTTITGSVLDNTSAPTSSSLVIDKTPDSITFTPQTGVAQSTAIDSNTVTIGGVNSYLYLTSSDVVYASVNSASFELVPSSGTSLFIEDGQTLALRQTSSSGSNTATTVTVTVGGGSADFTVTTITSGIVTPSITSPINGSTGISATATLTSSAYAVVGAVGTHLNSDWEISSDAVFGNIVASSLASTTNLTTWTPTGLSGTTQYWARVLYRSTDGVVSSWSTTSTWTTAAVPGVNWTPQTSGTGADLYGVTWNGSQAVAVGMGNNIVTSPNCITWSKITTTVTGDWDDVTWGNSLFMATGNNGKLATSPDGATWTQNNITTSNMLDKVIWANSMWVVVGESGSIRTSTNTTSWTARTSGTGNDLQGVIWNGTNLFVAVGNTGTILTSSGGTSWTTRTSGTSSSLYSVIWNGTNLFVAVGGSGTILTSPDGTTWTTRSSGITTQLNSVIWSGTQFVAVGSSGTILTSPDGTTWTTRSSGITTQLNSVIWSGTQFVAVGHSGVILTS